jgi:catalase
MGYVPTVAPAVPEPDQLSKDLVAAATEIYGEHSSRRALHAKGIWCEATFTATDEAGSLCRAAHFSGDAVPTLVRFSNGSGNPDSDDANREARGLAAKLRPQGGDENDMLATTARAFATRTPDDFLELLRLRKPDPETGQPDMEKLGAWLGEHPEAQPSIASTMGVEPPASFATVNYYSPHAFRYLDANDNGTWIRFRWRTDSGDEERIADDDARARGHDYLFDDLRERLAGGPVRFHLLIQVHPEGASLVDPTEVWPDDPGLIDGGTLEITSVVDDPEGHGHIEVFDPLRLGDGIEPSDDPVLHARESSYSVSAYRRLG